MPSSDLLLDLASTGQASVPLPTTGAVKVLHIINGEHYSGAERVQDILADRLPEFGFRAAFACVKPDRFPQVYQARHAPVYETAMRSRWDLRAARQVAALVTREGFGLLHAHTPRTAMVAALASILSGAPMVYHVHSPAAADSTRPWQNRMNAWVERVSLVRAAAVVCVSQSLADSRRWPRWLRGRVAVVPNGVPCREPRPPRAASEPHWTLGTVALFRPRKGLEVLLEALAVLLAWGLPMRLRAVGSFEAEAYRLQVLRAAAALGVGDRVDWVGFTQDVDRQLRSMDLFVLPSLFGEGLPMVVLEAMACGVPVVATRIEGIPEAIRDGRDGLLVEPGDPQALARAIAHVVQGRCDWCQLRQSALERHAERLSDEAMAAGVARVYCRVLASQRTAR